MRTKSYDAADLAPWDPWNGRDGPHETVPQAELVAHARAKSKLAHCRVALVNARRALDRSQCEEPAETLLARLETARLLFQGAERSVADLEQLLCSPAGPDYPPSEP